MRYTGLVNSVTIRAEEWNHGHLYLYRQFLPSQGIPVGDRKMEERIHREQLEDRVNIRGSFCMGHCTDGVCVRVGEKTISGVNAENFDEKFETEILGELRDE